MENLNISKKKEAVVQAIYEFLKFYYTDLKKI